MTTTELYTKGAKVWIAHLQKVWEGAELLEDYTPSKKTLKVQTEENEIKILNLKDENDLPHLKNPDILIGENDLTSLSYLHEPAVLHNLQVRFCDQKDIYTYCGIVLVAINPYDELPIYGNDTIQTYRGQAMGDLDPHIFAVAEEAYTKLEQEQKDQSIIVSGESGAGKTVSAKYTMRYFATVGGSATETQIEKKVLASSPIMEVSLIKNTVSLCEHSVQYESVGFLEKNRDTVLDEQIFLNVLNISFSLDYKQLKTQFCYHLGLIFLEDVSNFHYLNQGESPVIEGVSDFNAFAETLDAFKMLGFSDNELNNLFKILASILHLGNISFVDTTLSMENEQNQEGCQIPAKDKSLAIICDLLEINGEQLKQWLCTKKITSMNDVILKPMTVEQAVMARDALAKHIYAELFTWIVNVINKALESDSPRHKFIGVLDIYGFETFEINSFEQFCINYANEKLQQQFNLHVFKLEQEEYIREEIAWTMIDFYDNQPCIDLIEAKLGILDLLDEECRMPKGSDGSWTEKLYSKCSKYKHFSKPRFGNFAFVINHFADSVQYESVGFLEKNRDTVLDEQIFVLKNSKNSFVRRLLSDNQENMPTSGNKVKIMPAKPSAGAKKSHKKTVGSQFRDSLNLLMSTLNATTPHYVRCIKPNDNKASFEYNPQRAVQQLRACGVLETIRISAAGFPSRWAYIDFFYRYRVLCRSRDIDRNNMRNTCEKILNKYIKNKDYYQFGKTKIFFRAGQVAYLEKLRGEKLKKCCIIMQSTVRSFIARKKYLRLKKLVFNLQRYARGYLARRRANNLRRNKAAITIQRYVRGWLKRTQYQRIRKTILGLQSCCRGYLARKRFIYLKDNAMAIVIQRFARGYLARKYYKDTRRRIIICQAAVRRYFAKKQYKKLRIEARSIEHVKSLNKGLENKIISLQQKIEELNKTNSELKNFQNEALELRTKLSKFKALEIEIRNLNNLVIEKNKVIDKLQEEIKTEKDDKVDLVNELDKYKTEINDMKQLWTQETARLRKELENMNEIVKSSQHDTEEDMKKRLEQETKLLINEYDSDRQAYQKLLQEYHCLEQHCEDLEKQLHNQNRLLPFHNRNISDISSISTVDESLITTIHEDHGYGSVRSTTSTSSRGHLDNIDWNDTVNGVDSHSSGSPNQKEKDDKIKNDGKVDVNLVLKLQHKLVEIERERDRMQKRLDDIDMSPRTEKERNAAHDAIKISELEVANCNLKTQLFELRRSIDDGTGSKKLVEEISNLQEQLDQKMEEIVQLKSILANQTSNMKSLVSNKMRPEYINEDGELALAYETQKRINKQLELELQDEKAKFKAYEKDYKNEIEKLREDNERQQRLLSSNLNPQSQNEAYMQHEITRLTTENLSLHDRNDLLNESVRKLKKQVKILTRKLKEIGQDFEDNVIENEINKENGEDKYGRMQPVVRKKEREYLGMFSYKSGDENVIMKHLVVELKPRTAVTLLPGLPAYIIFMCIRHTDYINDEEKVKALLSSFTNSVKRVVRKRNEDFETMVLWESNTIRLLHNMKQYSGDKAFQSKNTPKQNEQCLRNFDLSEYRQVISDMAVWIYQGVIKLMEEKIQHLIVPAILEHEEIQGFGGKPSGFRGRLSSKSSELNSPGPKQKPLDTLLQELTNQYKILSFYGIDPEVISQIFKQLYYFMCVSSLNNLLLRKELCNWSKGLQIRHNLSHLEMWTREKNLQEKDIQATLQPIIQAAQLLQARKNDEDVDSVCDMCSDLTTLQICKILNLYTPVDEFEQKVPASFIRKVEAKLRERSDSNKQQTLLMDILMKFPIRFPFNPSVICLEDVEIPEVLKLGKLLEKV
ncbi:unconventional myosin-Va [Agrilus planipennis]|uniref:Unconventional myosin-Va n=1 Tax=Agrilus planipennis TaxID=224129 RepID=A0A7F5R1R5_AGRPL|nr:unconventional myosin-Va [Agrilus planipennis]